MLERQNILDREIWPRCKKAAPAAHDARRAAESTITGSTQQRQSDLPHPNLNSPITIGYGGINAATGKETFNLSTITSPTFQGTFNRDDLRSRWQAQFWARVRF